MGEAVSLATDCRGFEENEEVSGPGRKMIRLCEGGEKKKGAEKQTRKEEIEA